MAETLKDELERLRQRANASLVDLERKEQAWKKLTPAERVLDIWHGIICRREYSVHYQKCSGNYKGANINRLDPNANIIGELLRKYSEEELSVIIEKLGDIRFDIDQG